MNDELPLCPFCGGKAIIEKIDGCEVYDIACSTDNCVEQLYFSSEAEAIAWWSRRATPPMPAMPEEVREAIEAIMQCDFDWIGYGALRNQASVVRDWLRQAKEDE